MKVNVTEKSPIERTLEVAVEKERVDQAYEKAFRSASRHLSLPGFRKGKVPPAMARRHISDSALGSTVLEELVPEAYLEALKQESLKPLSEPKWEVVEHERGKELVFKATFEVKPHIEITDYKGLEITQERAEVTDAQVEEALERIRQGHAQLVQVTEDRGLQQGDVALVDFQSSENGEALPRGSADNYPLELVENNYVPGFLENLYGMKPGEERDFEVDFPADYPSELAGKHVAFHFSLKEIKERKAPELDDAFAADVSDCKTVEELRTRIRERMESEINHEAEHGVANQVFTKLLEQIPQDMIPPSLVIQKARMYSSDVARDLNRRGGSLQDMLKEQGKTEEDWSNHALSVGYGEARMDILIESLARQEGVEVTDEDMDPQLAQQAERTGQNIAGVRRRMEEEGTLDLLKSHILRHKVMHAVVDAAKVTYVPPQEKPAVAEDGEGSAEEEAPAGAVSEA